MWKLFPSSFPVCYAAQLLLVAVVFAAWVEELAKQQLSRCLSACNIVYIAYSLPFVSTQLHVVTHFCVMMVHLEMFGFLFFKL